MFNELERYAASHPLPTLFREPRNTTHYSVVDPAGNAVAVTTTLNDTLGSRVTLEGLGFLLNDEMDDFASKQGVPNAYGLIQGPANAIGPAKRPLSAMTPRSFKGWKIISGLGCTWEARPLSQRRQCSDGSGRLRARYSGSRQRKSLPSPVVAGRTDASKTDFPLTQCGCSRQKAIRSRGNGFGVTPNASWSIKKLGERLGAAMAGIMEKRLVSSYGNSSARLISKRSSPREGFAVRQFVPVV